MNDHADKPIDKNIEKTSLDLAEYALGTLAAPEAAALEQQLASSAELRAELASWEACLAEIGLGITPVGVPAVVWQQVVARTGIAAPAGLPLQESEAERDLQAAPRSTSAQPGPAAAARRRRQGVARGWRVAAIAASVVAVICAGLLFSGSVPGGSNASPAYASVIYDQPTGMSWLITAADGSDDLSIVTMGNFPLPSGKVLRAWLEPAQGGPLSLGEFPPKQGRHRVAVSAEAVQAMSGGGTILVSMEDADQPRGDRPVGRLMWVSPIAHRAG